MQYFTAASLFAAVAFAAPAAKPTDKSAGPTQHNLVRQATAVAGVPLYQTPEAEVGVPLVQSAVAEVGTPLVQTPVAEVGVPLVQTAVAGVPLVQSPEAEVGVPLVQSPVAEVGTPLVQTAVAGVPLVQSPEAEVGVPLVQSALAGVPLTFGKRDLPIPTAVAGIPLSFTALPIPTAVAGIPLSFTATPTNTPQAGIPLSFTAPAASATGSVQNIEIVDVKDYTMRIIDGVPAEVSFELKLQNATESIVCNALNVQDSIVGLTIGCGEDHQSPYKYQITVDVDADLTELAHYTLNIYHEVSTTLELTNSALLPTECSPFELANDFICKQSAFVTSLLAPLVNA